jgi:glucosamine-phosphate N-acetyltransferase
VRKRGLRLGESERHLFPPIPLSPMAEGGRAETSRPYVVRELRKEDIRRGFLETLLNLSEVSPQLIELHEKIFEQRRRLRLTYGGRRIPVYYTVVAVWRNSEVIATATLLTELKHIHDGGLVGHVEDVSRRAGPQYRGLGAGRACVEELIRFGREIGCYKIVLDCSEKNVPFYESLGFRRHEVGMRLDLPRR